MEVDAAHDEAGGGSGEEAGEDGPALGSVARKLARTEAFPFRVEQPLQIIGSLGPTFHSGRSSCLYDVAAGAASPAPAGAAAAGGRILQPFQHGFRPPGAGMAASMMSFPFTSSQWQELERQALVYKYMVASVPVPPELLIPIFSRVPATNADSAPPLFPHFKQGKGSSFSIGFSRNTDPEPGRCRRTDGKKWRCSRDAAPEQKYCERHLHRGRPRSRKPVEATARSRNASASSDPHRPLPTLGNLNPMPENPQWQLVRVLEGSRASSNDGSKNHSCLFLDADHTTEDHADLDQRRQPSRGFIDAWSLSSTGNPTRCSSPKSSFDRDGNHPVSSLTLSMPSYDDSTFEDLGVGADPAPWLSFSALGGPLGEVLQQSSGTAGGGSNSDSPRACSGSKSPSEPLNLMAQDWGETMDRSWRSDSSPSGVLPKALVSPSGSSSSSNRTVAVEKSEVAHQWLCHRKFSS